MVPQKLYEKLLLLFSVLTLLVCVGFVVADYCIPSPRPAYAEILESSTPPGVYLVNINTADQATLKELPGIGDTYAERIIAFREAHGPYSCAEDLTNVEGIGEALVKKLQDLITF